MSDNKKRLNLNDIDRVSDMKGIIFSRFTVNKDFERIENIWVF